MQLHKQYFVHARVQNLLSTPATMRCLCGRNGLDVLYDFCLRDVQLGHDLCTPGILAH